MAYPSNAILLANSAPSKDVLGTINGIAASTASLCRALGPTVSGFLYALGLQTGYSGLAWWFSGATTLVGAYLSSQITEGGYKSATPEEEETFAEEMKVVRSPGVQDTHIHAVFLILDPARLDRNIAASRNRSINGQNSTRPGMQPAFGAVEEDIDAQVLRMLYKRTTVIPVIAKADTITTKHMNVLKRSVWNSIKTAGLDPLEALGLEEDSNSISSRIDEEDEDETGEGQDESKRSEGVKSSTPPTSPASKRLSSQSFRKHRAAQEESDEEEMPFLPLSIISPDLYEPSVVGRQFPWGFADPYNEQHCDFQRLKEAVFTEWRAELREASKEQWYENWRTNKKQLLKT